MAETWCIYFGLVAWELMVYDLVIKDWFYRFRHFSALNRMV